MKRSVQEGFLLWKWNSSKPSFRATLGQCDGRFFWEVFADVKRRATITESSKSDSARASPFTMDYFVIYIV
eukprot:4592238-Amphidinium_carterae.1